MQARPVHPVDKRRKLRCSQSHHAVADRRPPERPVLQPLPEQHQAGPIPRQDLEPVRPLRAEDEDRPRERILPKLLAHQGRETVGTAAEVHRLRGHQHAYSRRNRDHVAARTARRTSTSQPTSTPRSTRTTTPAISIVIKAAAGFATAVFSGATTTGTNSAAASAGSASRPARAALRQTKRCWGVTSCRRATSDTTAPGAYDSATIRPLSSSLQRRRRPTPTRMSMWLRRFEASTICSTIYANRSIQSVRICTLSSLAARWGQNTAYACSPATHFCLHLRP